MCATTRLHCRLIKAGLALFCLSMFAGCSSFDKRWNETASIAVPADSIEGRWEGVWLSKVNGHTGPLRCIITKKGEHQHQAEFHAKYKRLITLSFGYTVLLKVERHGDEFRFEGEADLGWLAGGVYKYAGKATLSFLDCTYRSKRDQGTFEMRRPEPAGAYSFR